MADMETSGTSASTETSGASTETTTTQQSQETNGAASAETSGAEGGQTETAEPSDIEGYRKAYNDTKAWGTKTAQELSEYKKTHIPKTEFEKYQQMVQRTLSPPNPVAPKLEAAKQHEAEIKAEIEKYGESPELLRALADAEFRREGYEERAARHEAEQGQAFINALGKEKALKAASPEFVAFVGQDEGLSTVYALLGNNAGVVNTLLGIYDAYTGNAQTAEARAALDAQAAEKRAAAKAPNGGATKPAHEQKPKTFAEALYSE